MRVQRLLATAALAIGLMFVAGASLAADGGRDFLTAAQKAWLSTHAAELQIAPEVEFPPFSFVDEGTWRGQSADLIKLVEVRLGTKFSVRPPRNLSSILNRAKRGEPGIVTSVTETPERAQYLAFTQPYVNIPTVILVKADSPRERWPEGFIGRKVAVGKGYGVQSVLEKNYPGIKLMLVPDDREGLRRLSSGLVDGAILDVASASFFIDQEKITDLRVLCAFDFTYKLSFAVRKDLPVLREILSRALQTIPEADMRVLAGKWHINLDPANILPQAGYERFLPHALAMLALLTGGGAMVWIIRRRRALPTRRDMYPESHTFDAAPIGKSDLHYLLPASIALLLSLVALLVVWQEVSHRYEKDLQDTFVFQTQRVTTKINERMLAYGQILRGGAGFFAGSTMVNRDGWQAFVAKLDLNQSYSGIQGVGYSLLIPREKLRGHIGEIRKQGFPDFEVWPSGDRKVYTSILYLEPFSERNLRAFGYDMFAEPVRNEAMSRARDSGDLALSGRVKLVQETSTDIQAGLLAYFPVYKKDALTQTLEQRRAALMGWSYSPYRMNDLLDPVVANELSQIRLEIFDEGTRSTDTLLFDSLHGRLVPAATAGGPDISSIQTIAIGGRYWTLRYTAMPGYAEAARLSPPANELVALTVIGLLLLGLAWVFINTRRKAENIAYELTDSLRRSEERYASVERAVDEALWERNLVADEIFCSPRWKNLLGYELDEFPKRLADFVALVHPDDLEQIKEALRSHLEERKPYLVEYRLRHKEGSYRWMLSRGEALRDSSGRPLRLLGAIMDITERKQSEIRLQALLAEQKAILDNDLICLVRVRDRHIVWANHAFEKMLGYGRGELAGVPTLQIYTSIEAYRALGDAAYSVLSAGGVYHSQVEHVRKDGKKIWVNLSGAMLDSERGESLWGFVDITELKQTEDTLRKLSTAVEQSPMSVVIADLEARIQYVNPRFEQATGYASAEVLGENPRILQSGEMDKKTYQEMWNTLTGGQVWKGELRNKRKNGELYWEYAQIAPVRDVSGKVTHYVAVKNDITEQKRNEQALLDAEHHYRALANGVSTLIWKSGPDKLCNYFNEPWLTFTGRTIEQELGNGWAEGVHPEEFDRCLQIYVESFDRRQAFSMEYRLHHADGSYHWILDDGRPMYDSHGEFLGYIGSCTDISERKQAEESLRLAANVFSHAREGIMITESDGTILDVNATFARITGYSREEVLGQNPRLLSSGRHGPEFYAAMWHDLVEKGYWNGEVWNRRKNGEVFAEMQTVSAVRDEQGKALQYVSLFSDITPLKEHEKQLEHIAHYDALTGLPNRVLLADRLHLAMAQAVRHKRKLALAYLDLDGFKAINDDHGHNAGDQLLITVAARMKEALRDEDTLSRIGGDEFVAILADLGEIETSADLYTRLLAAAARPVHIDNIELQVSASVGVTFYPQVDEIDAEQLLRQADHAMYQAKLGGKNRFHIFDAEQDRSVRGNHESLERIKLALARREFLLYYQPKVNMRTGKVHGVEALIRWQHPEIGLQPPSAFLPLIETHALSIELGEWVIDTALEQIEIWQAAGLEMPVSVNVSAQHLQQENFQYRLAALLALHPQVHPGLLQLEVLETSALADMTHVSGVMHDCLEIGVTFALDDFGTGYSSLTYLKRLPAATLKIDQSFVRDMLNDSEDLTILEGVLGLATAFRRQVIAEGVENIEQGRLLLQLGCELAQGYHIARPMPACQLLDWTRAWHGDPAWANVSMVSLEERSLLFAGVEHRGWMTGIDMFLGGEQRKQPTMAAHQCRFGHWLDAEMLAEHDGPDALRVIDALHKQVHAKAQELLDIHIGGAHSEALAGVNELRELSDKLLVELVSLQQLKRQAKAI